MQKGNDEKFFPIWFRSRFSGWDYEKVIWSDVVGPKISKSNKNHLIKIYFLLGGICYFAQGAGNCWN